MSFPLVVEIKGNLRPLDVFSSLYKGRDYSFWLDSGMDKTKLGRYSFIGGDPFLIMTSCGNEITLDANGESEVLQGDPFTELYRLTESYSIKNAKIPVPFGGGAVGYFSYNLYHFIERLPSKADKDITLPECFFAFYDVIIAFDHLESKTYILSSGLPKTSEKKRMKHAAIRLEEVKKQLNTIVHLPVDAKKEVDGAVKVSVNFSREEYIKAVEQARRYIIEGDIFEVNLSQRFQVQCKVEPFTLYRRLRQINPAPFACYLSMSKGQAVVSTSPERFLKITKDRVETRPIKGTRPRGTTSEEDEILAQELLTSVKDRAENMMIVDLSRNDLGRVCNYGTVKVSELAILEKYPTVFHLTSEIEGQLQQNKDWHDVIRAVFPGGSITGAPKIRSVEIIDEIEPTARSVYTGNIGYIGLNGDVDLNIAIRTIIIDEGNAYFQVGGAITYDSKAEEEYRETLDKARALFMALGLEEK